MNTACEDRFYLKKKKKKCIYFIQVLKEEGSQSYDLYDGLINILLPTIELKY